MAADERAGIVRLRGADSDVATVAPSFATVGEHVSSGFLSTWVLLMVLAEASLIAAHYMAAGGGAAAASDVALIRTVSTAAPAVLCAYLLWQKGNHESDATTHTLVAFVWFVAADTLAAWQDTAQRPFIALAACVALCFLTSAFCARGGGVRLDLGAPVVGVAAYLAWAFVLPRTPSADADVFAFALAVGEVSCLAAAAWRGAAAAFAPDSGFGAWLGLFGTLMLATAFACSFVLQEFGVAPGSVDHRDLAVLAELCRFFSYVSFSFAVC